jgi:signal transduction histidine kinase
MNDPAAPLAFDRGYTLASFVESVDRDRLAAALAALLGPEFVLEDEQGLALMGQAPAAPAAWRAAAIEHEFEVLGRLRADCPEGTLAAAAGLLRILVAATARDRMIAELHLQATQDNYRSLLQQHAELEASEARYRELSAQLEHRVKQQVGVIESAQRQLFQAEKMASVGQLAAGMAHEINNPIGFIGSNLRTAREYASRVQALRAPVEQGDVAACAALWQRLDLDYVLDDFGTLLDESAAGAERIARIVADLKAFSCIDTSADTLVDLNACLPVVTRLAQAQFGAHAHIALELDALPPVRGDGGKLNQVFLSLLQNADQAVADGGSIVVRGAFAGGRVNVTVEDDGAGIAPELLSRVFDPFFTTRAVGQGTGLGLTVSRDIVMAHGGDLTLESEPGRGTRVTVCLPASRG